jgi:hypothetical protein
MKALLASSVLCLLAGSACKQAPPAADTTAVAAAAAAPAAARVDTTAQAELEVAPIHSPVGDVEFLAVLDLKQQPKPGVPQVRGGQLAKSTDWPASLYATFKENGDTFSCTAALLGPQVMLTAAHCVPTTGKVSFKYDGHAQSYTASCTRHPNYSTDESADFALCSVSPAFAEPNGFLYERINSSAMTGHLDKDVILAGYGCFSDDVGARGDGKYRVGSNSFDETSESASKRRGAKYYQPKQANNLFTKEDKNAAQVCPGDSGGPAFVRTKGGANTFGNRSVIGVNSRVFLVSKTKYGSSLISSTGGPDFLTWAQDWAKAAKLEACGIRGALTSCRS